MPWPPGSRPSRSTCSPTTPTAKPCWPTTGSATVSTRCGGWGARWPVRWTLPPGPTTVAPTFPVLDDWDGIGRPTAAIAHHPSHREAGRQIYGTGIMTAYAESGVDGRTGGRSPRRPVTAAPHRYILSLFHLTAQAGEAGHNCPLACDAGAIRTLQHVGTAEQQAQFLPGPARPGLRHQLHRLAVPHGGARGI